MKTPSFLTAASVIIFLVSITSTAQVKETSLFAVASFSKALTGLQGVIIEVSDLHSEFADAGLSTEQITRDVELKLRQSGIYIATNEEGRKNINYAYLSANIVLKKHDDFSYLYSVEIDTLEAVSPRRNPKMIVFKAVTWRRGSSGIAGAKSLSQLRDIVKDTMDEFCNDYLKANPKK